MPREFEIKYRLTEAAFAALSGQYGPFRQIRMETTYFDTPRHALSARKWTLRRRYENGVSVCTLKTPSPDGGRGEWEVTCPDIADALEPLVALGAPEELLHLGADLRPLCAARFVRLAAAKAGAFTDLFAQEAFRIAYGSLPASFAGRQEVRLKLHMASCMAGIAFSQAGLGLCHAMAHSLGGRFHVPHGRLNAILLPAVIENNASSCGKKYAQLARAAGMGGSADTVALRNLKNGLIRLRRELGLPQSLTQAGVAPGKIWGAMGEIVESVLSDPCCKTNPIPVEDFQVRRILEEVTGHL